MTVTFTYGVDELELPNPSLGNSKSLNINTNFKMAMDGKVYSYIKTPIKRKFFMTFNSLTDDDITNIITFIKENGYQELNYNDHDGDDWTGKITSNPLETIQPNRGFYSMVLEFEGVAT